MRSRVVLVAALLSLGAWAVPQRGGFDTGNLGGSAGSNAGRQVNIGTMMETHNRLFLSPGDRTEWTFDAKGSEAVIVSITSGMFDPAVAIQDAEGKVLAENDDLSPGNQMAQAVVVAPRDGTYKVVVTNYKGTAGGPFESVTRRFATVSVPYRAETSFEKAPSMTWGRIDVEQPIEISVTIRNGRDALQVVRPSGETWFEAGRAYAAEPNVVRWRVKIAVPGTYFLWAGTARERTIRVNPIPTYQGLLNSELSGTFAEDDLHQWKITVPRGTVIEFSPPDGSGVAVELPFDAGPTSASLTKVLGGMPTSRYLVGTVGTGSLTFTVRHVSGRAGHYRIAVRTKEAPMAERGPTRSQLGWTDTGVWVTEAAPGTVLRLVATAGTYRPYVRVLCPDGSLVSSTPLLDPPDVGLSILSYIQGPYIVCVTGGGIGDYELRREVLEPKRLALGENAGALAPGTPEVWRFELTQTCDAAFRLQGESPRCTVTVYDPDGSRVALIQDGEDFARVKLTKAGPYRVEVHPTDGFAGKYVLKWISLD